MSATKLVPPASEPGTHPYSHELDWPEGMEPWKVVDDGSQGDPYAHYTWMHKNAPVVRAWTPDNDVWFIADYAEVRNAFRKPKIFSSEVVKPVPMTFLTLIDDPEHARLRQVIAKAFTPKALKLFQDLIDRNAERLLNAMIAKGGGDIVHEFAIPLSMTTIATLLNVPAEDHEKMKFWSDETFSYFGRLARNAPGTGTDEQSAKDFWEYLRVRLEELYEEESESMGGHIARMWKDEGVLTEQEAKELCSFVFIAGHDTTTILIANAFRMFAEEPDMLERIRNNEADAPKFVEEVARFRGTVQRASRVTTEEVEVSGVTLPKGAIVRLLNAAANRDPDKYDDPDTFNIDRDNSGHLGFGAGVHSCAGAPLARMEVLASVLQAARTLKSVTLDPENPITYVRGNNLTNSGPDTIHVKLEALDA